MPPDGAVPPFRPSRSGGNIVFSPYSIGTAMAMVLSGARGETEREMAAVLGCSSSRADIAAANAAVLATLKGYDKRAATPTCPTGRNLPARLARARQRRTAPARCAASATGRCVARRSRRLRRAARRQRADARQGAGDLMSEDYAALLKESSPPRFSAMPRSTTSTAGSRSKTEGKIEKLLDRLDPIAAARDPRTPSISRRDWRTPFDKAATRARRISDCRRGEVQVPTMRLRVDFAWARGRRLPGYPFALQGRRAVHERSCCRTGSTAWTASRSGSTTDEMASSAGRAAHPSRRNGRAGVAALQGAFSSQPGTDFQKHGHETGVRFQDGGLFRNDRNGRRRSCRWPSVRSCTRRSSTWRRRGPRRPPPRPIAMVDRERYGRRRLETFRRRPAVPVRDRRRDDRRGPVPGSGS